jgi:cytoskeletal protein RodZ
MSDIEALGNELREARQRRDLTLSEVERKIHIRAKFLEALECGQVALLPSPVQARGFLRNYARFLGLDPDSMIARWDEAVQGGTGRRRRRQEQLSPARSTQTRPAVGAEPSTSTRRGLRLGTLLFGLLLLIMVGGLLIMGGQWFQATLAGATGSVILSPLPTSPEASATPTPTSAPATDIPGPTPLPNPNVPPTGNVAVQLQITGRTWLRVTVDGQVSYLGAPGPNTVLQYRGNAVNVRASNASGVHAIVNNRDMGALGARGQIFDQTFTASGMIAPTGTPLPTPTSQG